MVRLFGREDRRRHELLSAYVDGEVTAEEAREVEDLLETSEDARRELAELQATVNLVRGLPELEPPRSFALDAAPKKRWTLWWPSVRATGTGNIGRGDAAGRIGGRRYVERVGASSVRRR